jgi:hypothetical protein
VAKVTALVALPTARKTPAGATLGPADIGAVTLYRSADGTTFAKAAVLAGPFTTPQVSVDDVTVPDPTTADVSYAYKATATDLAGKESDQSDSVPVVVKVPLGAPAAPVIVSLTAG